MVAWEVGLLIGAWICEGLGEGRGGLHRRCNPWLHTRAFGIDSLVPQFRVLFGD